MLINNPIKPNQAETRHDYKQIETGWFANVWIMSEWWLGDTAYAGCLLFVFMYFKTTHYDVNTQFKSHLAPVDPIRLASRASWPALSTIVHVTRQSLPSKAKARSMSRPKRATSMLPPHNIHPTLNTQVCGQ